MYPSFQVCGHLSFINLGPAISGNYDRFNRKVTCHGFVLLKKSNFMPFMQRTYEEIKTNNTVCFTYYQWGSWVAATTVSQTDLTINRSHHNTWFPLIDFIDVKLAFSPQTPPPHREVEYCRYLDTDQQIFMYCRYPVIHPSVTLYIDIHFSAYTKSSVLIFSEHLFLSVSILVWCPGNIKQSLHPPLSRSINKKAAPFCTH